MPIQLFHSPWESFFIIFDWIQGDETTPLRTDKNGQTIGL